MGEYQLITKNTGNKVKKVFGNTSKTSDLDIFIVEFIDGSLGYIDKYKNEIASGFILSFEFTSNLGCVKFKEGDWGYVDRENTTIARGFKTADSFVYDLGFVSFIDSTCGYVNREGKVVIRGEMTSPNWVTKRGGFAWERGRYCYYDNDGAVLIKNILVILEGGGIEGVIYAGKEDGDFLCIPKNGNDWYELKDFKVEDIKFPKKMYNKINLGEEYFNIK